MPRLKPLDTARNMALDACDGDAHSTRWPASLQLALFNGDPTAGGTEMTNAGSYARAIIANTSANFPDAASGVKTSGATTQFAPSTAAYSAGFNYWAFFDGSGNILDSGQVTDPNTNAPVTITVSQANTIVRFLAGKLAISVS